MADAVERGDSFDGSLEYHARIDSDQDFDVSAVWRVGNSEGQGGIVTIGEDDPPPPADESARRARLFVEMLGERARDDGHGSFRQ